MFHLMDIIFNKNIIFAINNWAARYPSRLTPPFECFTTLSPRPLVDPYFFTFKTNFLIFVLWSYPI